MANLCIKTPSSAIQVLIFQLLVLRPRPILGPTLLILGSPLLILGPTLLILELTLLILVVKMGIAIRKKTQTIQTVDSGFE